MTLYDLTEELRNLVSALEECSEEEAATYITAFLGSGDVVQKVDAYCTLIRETEERMSARTREIARLENLVAADKRTVTVLKERLMAFLQVAGRTRLDTDRFSVRVQNNGGMPPVVLSVAPEALPPEFVRVRIEPDMRALAEALASGREVPGASFGERGRRLVIR